MATEPGSALSLPSEPVSRALPDRQQGIVHEVSQQAASVALHGQGAQRREQAGVVVQDREGARVADPVGDGEGGSRRRHHAEATPAEDEDVGGGVLRHGRPRP